MKLLRRLKLDRVDFVPRGANPEAHIKLFKSSDPLLTVTADEVSEEERMTVEELQAQLDTLTAEKAATDAELATAKAELDKPSEIEAAQAEVATLKAELAKAADVDVRKELDTAKADLAEVRKAQRKTEFVTLAKEFEDLGSPVEIAELLMAADEHFGDEPKALLEKFLKSANEQVKTGSLFARLSKDNGDESQTWEEQLTTKARDLVAKGTSDTIEQAKVQVMSDEPEIRKAYEQSVRS